MWSLFWDTIGFVADTVPRNVKLLLAALLLLVVFFFFGQDAVFYFIGGIFWLCALFFVIANLFVRGRRAREKAKTVAVAPLTQDDQADIAEFQEAMEKQPAARPVVQPHKKGAPPENLPEATA